MIKQARPVLAALLLAFTGILGLAGRGEAVVGVGATLFDKGKTRLSLTGGWGSAFNQTYFVLGAGAGYYVMRGLEVGVDWESWMGSNPGINKLTPEVRYIFQNAGSFFPYLGGFYRRTFYEEVEDADSVGGRLGAYMPVGGNSYFGIGGVFERQLDCDTNIYDDCSLLYPEFVITVAF